MKLCIIMPKMTDSGMPKKSYFAPPTPKSHKTVVKRPPKQLLNSRKGAAKQPADVESKYGGPKQPTMTTCMRASPTKTKPSLYHHPCCDETAPALALCVRVKLQNTEKSSQHNEQFADSTGNDALPGQWYPQILETCPASAALGFAAFCRQALQRFITLDAYEAAERPVLAPVLSLPGTSKGNRIRAF